MHRSRFLPFFLVLLLILILLGINYFTPILTPERSDNLPYLLMLALLAAITIATGVLALRGGGKGSEKDQPRVDEKQAKRNREDMLQLVWNTWIEDVLKKGLYFENPITLDIKTEPDAIPHPYDLLLSIEGRKPQPVPPDRLMLEHFDKATGALLILGEPGSGKSTLLLELASQAIQRAQGDLEQPIPVVFKLSSWTPEQTLTDWLVGEMRQKYQFPVDISRQWVTEGELLLLLDGLDEVKAEFRKPCVEAINTYREGPGAHMALTCRTQEYQAIGEKLDLHGALMVQSLNERQVQAFLAEEGDTLSALKAALESDAGLRQFASTPLVLSVMKQTYQDGGEGRLEALKSAEDYRSQLFEDYVERMLRHRKDGSSYPLEDIRRWLAWLAGFLRDSGQALFYVEDIRIDNLPDSKKKYWVIFGLVIGFIFGLLVGFALGSVISTITGLVPSLIFGLIAGLMVWFLSGLLFYFLKSTSTPSERLKLSNKGIIGGFLGGLILGSMAFLAIGVLFSKAYDVNVWESSYLIGGLVIALMTGVFFAIIFGVRGSQAQSRNAPGMGIRASRRTMVIFALIFSLIMLTTLVALTGELKEAFILLSGLIMGLAGGFLFGGFFLLSHYLSRWHLVRSGKIPWKVIPFLEFCTNHILLQRAGGGYQFIHPLLKDYFAALNEPAEELQGRV